MLHPLHSARIISQKDTWDYIQLQQIHGRMFVEYYILIHGRMYAIIHTVKRDRAPGARHAVEINETAAVPGPTP